jgi:hypothetical protein|tara:strand:+ start:1188 stop:1292 length:105 start_codon:yes stop_codon:yes gene_type:complete
MTVYAVFDLGGEMKNKKRGRKKREKAGKKLKSEP